MLTASRQPRLISPLCLRLSAAQMSGQQHEKNLSTQQTPPQAHPWLSGAHGNQTWPAGIERTPRQGPGSTLPVSPNSNGFPPAFRLHTPAEFNQVFRSGTQSTDACFRAYASNNQDSARLGISVSRKTIPAAVDRNRIKRLVRDSFRKNHATLPAADIVIQARRRSGYMDNAGIRNSLDWHWQELKKLCVAS